MSDLQKTILVCALEERQHTGATLEYRLSFTSAVTDAHTPAELQAKAAALAGDISTLALKGQYWADVSGGTSYSEAQAIKARLDAAGLPVGEPWAISSAASKYGVHRPSDIKRPAIMRICYANALARVQATNLRGARRWNDDLAHWRYADRAGYQAAHAAMTKALDRLKERGLLIHAGHKALCLTEDGIRTAKLLAVEKSELMAKLSIHREDLANKAKLTEQRLREYFALPANG